MNERIYLRHGCTGTLREACEEDTKYYLFDDSSEPVGLLAEPKEEWERLTAEQWEQARTHESDEGARQRREQPQWWQAYEATTQYMNRMLLARVLSPSTGVRDGHQSRTEKAGTE